MYSIQYIQLFSVHFVFIYFKSNFIECISSGIIILSILVRVRIEYRLSRQPNKHTQKRRNNALNIKNYRFHFLIAADVEKSSYFFTFFNHFWVCIDSISPNKKRQKRTVSLFTFCQANLHYSHFTVILLNVTWHKKVCFVREAIDAGFIPFHSNRKKYIL